MRILILTNQIPYPLDSGGNIAQYMFIDYMRNIIDLTLITEIKNAEDEKNFLALKNKWSNVELIGVDNQEFVPDYQYSLFAKAELAIKRRISKFFGSSEKQVIKEPNIFDIALWYLKPVSKKYIDTIEQYINQKNPDIIQVEQVPYITLGCLKTDIPKVYIHHELQTELLNSAKSSMALSNLHTDYTINLTNTIETNLLNKFQSIVVFSENDKIKLNTYGVNNVYNIPFPFDSRIIHDDSLPSESYSKLTFIGGDGHLPNVEAIEWYFTELGQVILEKLNLKLHVIGNWAPKNRKRFNCDFIVFEGYVEDLRISLINSINIVPVRIGSGIRTKILSAFGSKIPVISTEQGIEGIDVVNGVHYLNFENTATLLTTITKIINNINETNLMIMQAYENLVSKYNVEHLSDRRLDLYNNIINKSNNLGNYDS